MKKLLNNIAYCICVMILFCSCKGTTYEQKIAEVNSEKSPYGQPYVANTPDTSIGQQVWYNKGSKKYVLQTWVNTNKHQAHYSNNREGEIQFWVGDTPPQGAPYNVDIIGSFDYIRANKATEYNKAAKVLDSLRIQGYAIQMKNSVEQLKQKAIDDSVELLRTLPINIPKIVPPPTGTGITVIYDSTKK